MKLCANIRHDNAKKKKKKKNNNKKKKTTKKQKKQTKKKKNKKKKKKRLCPTFSSDEIMPFSLFHTVECPLHTIYWRIFIRMSKDSWYFVRLLVRLCVRSLFLPALYLLYE